MTSELVIFRAFFFFSFSELFFFIISRKNNKTSEVNQQSVFNLYIFHHFSKNLDRTITFNSVTLKNTLTEPLKFIIFFSTKQIIFSRRIKKKKFEIKFYFLYFLENYSRRVCK